MAANRSLSYYDPVSSAVGNLIETHEHTGDFEELLITRLIFPVNGSRGFYNNGLLKGDIMKAAVINAPNTEVRIEERHRPSPGRGEVLIRVHACGVCHGDLMLQLGQFSFARYPVVPGHEIAGVIEEVGEDVGKLHPGDRVGLSALFSSCGCCKE